MCLIVATTKKTTSGICCRPKTASGSGVGVVGLTKTTKSCALSKRTGLTIAVAVLAPSVVICQPQLFEGVVLIWLHEADALIMTVCVCGSVLLLVRTKRCGTGTLVHLLVLLTKATRCASTKAAAGGLSKATGGCCTTTPEEATTRGRCRAAKPGLVLGVAEKASSTCRAEPTGLVVIGVVLAEASECAAGRGVVAGVICAKETSTSCGGATKGGLRAESRGCIGAAETCCKLC